MASETNNATQPPQLTWIEAGATQHAQWWSANDKPMPKRVITVDDRLTADDALRNAAQGISMLWKSDFHNAKQLLSAVDRRIERGGKQGSKLSGGAVGATADEFYRLRQARAGRSRVMSMLLVEIVGAETATGAVEVQLPLPRSPRIAEPVAFAYRGLLLAAGQRAVVSLQELIGVLSAYQWYLSGVEVPSLGRSIYPHYGTFLPTRHEYVDLVAQAPLGDVELAFDIGVGTGVLSALLARRGVECIIGTDIYQRAVDCANENFERLGIDDYTQAQLCSMFPSGRADLIVCNPPWLPGSAATSLDASVYDPGSKMLMQFLKGLPDHLTEQGEGWLLLSDLAELLGLRTREQLLTAIAAAGLTIIERIDTAPTHNKVSDTSDVLHAARAREVTSLWRLRTS